MSLWFRQISYSQKKGARLDMEKLWTDMAKTSKVFSPPIGATCFQFFGSQSSSSLRGGLRAWRYTGIPPPGKLRGEVERRAFYS